MLQPVRLRHNPVLFPTAQAVRSLKFPPDNANARSYSRAVSSSDRAPDGTAATVRETDYPCGTDGEEKLYSEVG